MSVAGEDVWRWAGAVCRRPSEGWWGRELRTGWSLFQGFAGNLRQDFGALIQAGGAEGGFQPCDVRQMDSVWRWSGGGRSPGFLQVSSHI